MRQIPLPDGARVLEIAYFAGEPFVLYQTEESAMVGLTNGERTITVARQMVTLPNRVWGCECFLRVVGDQLYITSMGYRTDAIHYLWPSGKFFTVPCPPYDPHSADHNWRAEQDAHNAFRDQQAIGALNYMTGKPSREQNEKYKTTDHYFICCGHLARGMFHMVVGPSYADRLLGDGSNKGTVLIHNRGGSAKLMKLKIGLITRVAISEDECTMMAASGKRVMVIDLDF